MDKEQPIEPFDYDVLDDETRQFVQQKADEIHGQLKRTAEGIISIGHNLREVKQQLGHGHFLVWVKAEFDLTPRSAQRFMEIAEKFADKYDNLSYLSASVLYELAAPSTPETVVEGVLTGEIPSTLHDIREAKKHEQQARFENEIIQQQLQQERALASIQMAELTAQIERLQQEMTHLSTPQVKEVRIIPAEVTQQIEGLRSKVRTLTEQRDALSQHAQQLGERVKAMTLKSAEHDEARRLRSAWQTTTHAFQSAVLSILSQWPSPLDTMAFEASEWNRVEQVKELCSRVIDECKHLREETLHLIVDAKEDRTAY